MIELLFAASLAASPQNPIEPAVRVLTRKVDPARLERTVRDLVGFQTRHVLSATEQDGVGTGAARDYLQAQYEALIPKSDGRLTVGRESYEVLAQRLRRRDLPVVNIVATLKGTTDPDRVYVVGGHYDSINGNPRDGKGVAPGANDDASGTAVALEACRVLCEKPLAATILFVAYDGEEQGLLGSAAHAQALADAGAKVDGMITNDIVGNSMGMDGVRRDGYVRCFSYAPVGNDSLGRSLARAATFSADRHLHGNHFGVRLVFRGDRYGRGGDHRPFFNHGWPSLRFTEPREDYSRQHQNVTERDGKPYGDLPDYMDFEYLANVARVNVAVLAELASAPPTPATLRVSGARDAYDTLLYWSPVEGAEDYEVVWRDTTAADWQHALLASKAAEPAKLSQRRGRSMMRIRLAGVCLDEVVVGVRSVGKNGSRSRVSTPPEPDAFNQRRTREGR